MQESFSNPLSELKDYFQDWLKMQWTTSNGNVLTVIFAAEIIAYAIVGVSLSDAKFMEE